MSIIRFQAIHAANSRSPVHNEAPAKLTSGYFGINVFDKLKMQRYLSQEAYEGVMNCIEKGMKVDRKLADKVAAGMKMWALEMGATHFSHWFHPLTDGTAEK